MSTVYLPVELSRRELVARGFLGSSLAAHGHDVVVFRLDLFDRVGWPGPGIYIGKSCLPVPPPHDTRLYVRLKSAGIKVWHLDEEGGIYRGSDEENWKRTLAIRLDPNALAADDRILVWGLWQKAFMEARDPAAPCTVVGSPNFDVYQPKYHGALAAYDAKQTSGRSDFVLVNTRFSFANALTGFGARHFIHHSLLKKIFDLPTRLHSLANDGVLLYRFVGLVTDLAEKLPGTTIVLRPHPVENPDFYRSIFEPLPNVLVAPEGDAGSWIRRSRLLVHNGCTTAIQAAIAGKPVITYVPDEFEDSSLAGLPNEVGVRATTADQVVELVQSGLTGSDKGMWKRSIAELDSIETITAMVDAEAPVGGLDALAAAARAAKRFSVTEVPRRLARQLLADRKRRAEGLSAKFDPRFFATFPEIVDAADGHFGARSRVRRLSEAAFAIEGSRR